MDQNAFRNLLSTQAVKPGTGRSAGVLGTHAAKRGAGKSKSSGGYTFGKSADKKKEGKEGEDAGSAMAFAPRKAGGKKGGKGREDGKDQPYQDRAELRRLGKDDDANEFKAAEKLAEDFERRAREEGQDEEKIEEQRKYLGGDATHSILVKGLDYALLAARKAEIEATEGKRAEDELDALFEGELAAAGTSKVDKNVEEKPSGIGRKRTREEIVQQLKRQRTGAVADSNESVAPVQETLGSKFKSIAQKKREAEEAQAHAQAQGKKKLKKKKKVAPPAAAATEPAMIGGDDHQEKMASIQAADTGKPQPANEESKKGVLPMTVGQVETTSAAPSRTEKQTGIAALTSPILGVTPVPDEDDDDDIFGGVGEYVGAVASDSDSESDGDVGRNPSPRPATNGRRRSRSRSGSRSPSRRDDRRYEPRRDDRYDNDDRYPASSRGDRYDERDRYGNYRSRNDRSRPRSRSPDYDQDRRYDRGDYRSRTTRYDDRASYPRHERDGRYQDRQDRSRSRDRNYRSRDEEYRGHQRGREYGRSPSQPRSPHRQDRRRFSPSPRRAIPSPRRSRSRERSAKAKSPPRQSMQPPSRSPSPVNIDALRALSQSPGLSDGEDDPYAGPVRPGQSLRDLGFASSDVPSARELLEMDAIANQADEKRANKAKWRRAQGLAPQQGDDDQDDEDGGNKNRLGQELTEQQKMRRDQQRLQAYMDKKEKAAK